MNSHAWLLEKLGSMATSYPARELGQLSALAEVSLVLIRVAIPISRAKEGRILTNQWDLYDKEHITFVPSGISPEKLQEGFEWLNSSFLSWHSIFRRLVRIHRSLQIFGPMNFGFHNAWKKRMNRHHTF